MTAPRPVRVVVEDSWDQVTLDLSSGSTIGEIKRKALSMTHASGDPERYLVKFRGAEILDENRSLAESGVVPNAQLIVVHRRRRPVR